MVDVKKKAFFLVVLAILTAAACASRPPPRPPRREPPPTAPSQPLPEPVVEETVVLPPEVLEETQRKGSVVQRAFGEGNYRLVTRIFERVEERYPSHVKGDDDLYLLGMSHYYLDEDAQALKSLLEFQYRFFDDPRAPEVYLVTAKVFRRLGKTERALDAIRQAIYRAADDDLRLRAREEKADILAGEGRYLESLEVLDEAYARSGPDGRERALNRIRELLKVTPKEVVERSVLTGTWTFPREEAENVLASLGGPTEPPEAAGTGDDRGGERYLPAGPREGEDRPLVTIGVMVPASERFEAYSREIHRGVELLLAEREREGFPYRVEAVYADEGTGSEEEAVRGMVDDRDVVALIGPLMSSTVESILPAAEERSLAVFSPTAASPRLNGMSPNFFRNCFTLEQFGESLAGLATGPLGLRRFAIFVPDDIYGHTSGEAFRESILAMGGEIVAYESFDVTLTDFEKPIAKLKRSAGIPDPLPANLKESGEYELPFDGLFIPGYAESAGLILPQLSFHEVDVSRLAVIGGSGLNSSRLPAVGEEYAEGTFFADGFFAASPRRSVQSFVGLYRGRYGEEPGTFAAQAFDAASIILDALRRRGAAREGILEDLGEVRGFDGVAGKTTLRPGGILEREPFFGTVAKGRRVAFEADLHFWRPAPLSP